MRPFFLLTMALTLSSCVNPPTPRADEKIGVWCNSRDEGKTFWACGESYPGNTGDTCGRDPDYGVEFALKLRHEFSGNTMCETVVKTSHPKIMPIGERFCSITIEKLADGYTYRYIDDPPDKVRRVYRGDRSMKWCQPLIDSL